MKRWFSRHTFQRKTNSSLEYDLAWVLIQSANAPLRGSSDEAEATKMKKRTAERVTNRVAERMLVWTKKKKNVWQRTFFSVINGPM
jgi:hypothetical protein